jgi:hypothetical protein
MEESMMAYSLYQEEAEWVWRLMDEMGETVANGRAADMVSAERNILEAFHQTWRAH